MTDAQREAVAKAIYEQWSDKPGYRPWVERGNSDMQEKARDIVKAALRTAGEAAQGEPSAAIADVIDAFEQDLLGYHLEHVHIAEWINKLRDALAAQAPQAPAGTFLCRIWGEDIDHTLTAIVPDWDGVRAFCVEHWTGSEDATDHDGSLTLDNLKNEFDEHEEDERGGAYSQQWEIGGVSIERICDCTPRPGASIQAPADSVRNLTEPAPTSPACKFCPNLTGCSIYGCIQIPGNGWDEEYVKQVTKLIAERTEQTSEAQKPAAE